MTKATRSEFEPCFGRNHDAMFAQISRVSVCGLSDHAMMY
jgi:hypothetical protein